MNAQNIDQQKPPAVNTCNVSQKFNFTIGGISLLVAAIAIYLVCSFFR